jgi:hypothetical protein
VEDYDMRANHRVTKVRWLGILAIITLVLQLIAWPGSATAQDSVIKQAAQGRLRQVQLQLPGGISRPAPSFSGGVIATAQAMLGLSRAPSNPGGPDRAGISDDTLGCSNRTRGHDTRVNQDCTYEFQAEELIKANPLNPRQLIAGQNDGRIGFNKCGFDYSLDGGETWGDGVPPFYERLNNPPAGHTVAGGPGTNHTYDAGSDPALAFDSRGNAFYSCVVFDVASNASAVLVAGSPAYAHGSFYNKVPVTGPSYVAVEDNSPLALHDKEFITADSYPNSPFRDSVYVTWTVFKIDPVHCTFAGGYCSSAIYFSKSTDHAATWSAPQEISGQNPNLCFFADVLDPSRDPHDCDLDQGSDPIVRPDGSIVVVFNNSNTAANNPNLQQLAVISHDGGNTWSNPTKVGDDIITNEPLCDFGRGPEECIPGNFIRTNDFPRVAVDKANGDVYTTWQDYRFGEYDIILSKSTDGGRTWHEAARAVNPDRNRDHYQAAIDIGTDHQVAVSYYRTGRVPNENTTPPGGFTPGRDPGVQARDSDVFLAGGMDRNTPFQDTRVAQPFPPPDGSLTGFLGDYSGLVVVGHKAYPLWADTRNPAPSDQSVSHDADIFIDVLDIPGGDHK